MNSGSPGNKPCKISSPIHFGWTVLRLSSQSGINPTLTCLPCGNKILQFHNRVSHKFIFISLKEFSTMKQPVFWASFALSVLFLTTQTAQAQEVPRFEVGGQFSIIRFNYSPPDIFSGAKVDKMNFVGGRREP